MADSFDWESIANKPTPSSNGSDFDWESIANKPAPTVKQNKGSAGDLGTSLKRGVLGLPGVATGIADVVPAITTGTRPFTSAAEWAGEKTGFQPGKWREQAEAEYSPGYKESQAAIDAAWRDKNVGALETAAMYAKNPIYSVNQVVESIPSTLAGGVAARAALTAGRVAVPVSGAASRFIPGYLERATGKWAAPIAGAIGEGAVTTGQQMDQYEGDDQQRNAVAALGAGVLTGAIGAAGGRLANKLGFETVETAMAKGLDPVGAGKFSLPKRLAGGAASEGILQEFPQSMQEQMWQNYADGKPLMEGVVRSGVEGAISGAMMGAGANVRGGLQPTNLIADTPDPNLAQLPAPGRTVGTGMDSGALLQEASDLENAQGVNEAYAEYVQAQRDAEEARRNAAWEQYADTTENTDVWGNRMAPAPSGDGRTAIAIPTQGAGAAPYAEHFEHPLVRAVSIITQAARAKAAGMPVEGQFAQDFEWAVAALKSEVGDDAYASIMQRADQEAARPAKAEVKGKAKEVQAEQRTPVDDVLETFGIKSKSANVRNAVSEAMQASAAGEITAEQFTDFVNLASTTASKVKLDKALNKAREANRAPEPLFAPTGGQNAQQNQGAGTIDGRSSAQPAVRTEGGTVAEGGQGVQPSGQGQQVAQGQTQGQVATAKVNPLTEMDRVERAKVMAAVKDVLGWDNEGLPNNKPISQAAAAAKRGITRQALNKWFKKIGLDQTKIKRLLASGSGIDSVDLGELMPSQQEDEGDTQATGFTVTTNPAASHVNEAPRGDMTDEERAIAKANVADTRAADEWAGEHGADLTAEGDYQTAQEAASQTAAEAKREAEAAANRAYAQEVNRRLLASDDAKTAAIDWDEAKNETAPAFAELTEAAQASFVVEYIDHINNIDDSWDSIEAFIRGFEHTLEPSDVRRSENVGTQDQPGSNRIGSNSETATDEVAPAPVQKQPTVTTKRHRTIEHAQPDDGQLSEVKHSVGQGAGGQTVDALTAKLLKAFNNPYFFNRAVEVVQSESDLEGDMRADVVSGDGKVQAFYDPDTNRVWMIAGNIPEGAELSVLLHEVGVHMGMKNLLGPENYKKLITQLQVWVADGNLGGTSVEARLAKKAYERVKKAERLLGKPMSQETFNDELLAYFVEEGVNSGIDPTAARETSSLSLWFRKLWAAVKGAVRRLGMNADKLTAQNVVDMAYGAASIELGVPQPETVAAVRVSEPGANPDVRKFSIASKEFDANPTPQGFFEVLRSKLDDLLANPWGFVKTHGLGWMTLEQIEDRTKSKAVKAYRDVLTSMQSFSKNLVYKAALIEQDWALVDKMPGKVGERISQVMRDATREQYDPAKGELPANEVQQNILNTYNSLPQSAKDVYLKVRDYYEETHNLRKQIMTDAAHAAGRSKSYVDDLYATLKGPYFPLMRMGEWYSVGMSQEVADLLAKFEDGNITAEEEKRLDALQKDKAHYEARGHQSRAQAIRSQRELAAKFGGNAHFNKTKERIGSQMAVSMPELKKIEELLSTGLKPEVRSQVKDMLSQMYFDMLPENHALKRAMKRTGAHGEEENMRAVFAKSTISAAHYISRLKHAQDLGAAMVDVEKEGRKDENMRLVGNELTERNAIAMTPDNHPLVDRLLQVSYFAHLGISPAFILTNMSQVPMIGVPWLAGHHGIGRTTSAITGAYADAVNMLKATYAKDPKTGKVDWNAELKWEGVLKSENERALFDYLLKRNLLDITIEHDFGAVADMRVTRMNSVIRAANLPVRTTEFANRAVMALAAYRMGVEKGMSHEAAVEHAEKAVSETQLDYSGLNAPRYMQSMMGSKAIARMMFQFRKYQQGMLYLMIKNFNDAMKGATKEERAIARRTLFGLFATTGLMAGAVGVPFAGSVLAIASMFGGDDDDPFDAEVELRNFLADVFGVEVAAAIAKGLPTLIGMDLSRRIGMGDIASPLPFMRQGKTGTGTVANVLSASAGAGVGTIATMYDGMQALANGDTMKGAEKIVPLKAAKDALRAIRYAGEGMTDSKGNVILPDERFSSWDLAMRSTGLAPMKETEYYAANKAVQDKKMAAQEARTKLIRDAAQARLAGEDLSDINEQIMEFNKRHPDKTTRITASSIAKSAQNIRRMAKERGESGVRIDKTNRPYLDKVRFAEM